MYSSYQLYIELKPKYKELQILYDRELTICKQRLELKDEALWVLIEDREFVYNKINKTLDEIKNEERKNRIKIILFTSGGLITGAAIGFVIGFFAAQK